MPTRDSVPSGAPCWIDLMTSDTARTRDFYTALFNWTAGEASEEFGGYFMFFAGGVPVAGCMGSQQPDEPDVWSIYLATNDAAKAVEAATAAGGQVYVQPMQVADLGTMAVVADAAGAAIGMWQAGSFTGLTVLGEPGTPSWFELHTRDFQRSVDFCRNVFDWNAQAVSDTPEFRYTVLQHGDDQLAGIMDASAFLPEGVPAHWSVYFGTDDVDATVAGSSSSVARS